MVIGEHSQTFSSIASLIFKTFTKFIRFTHTYTHTHTQIYNIPVRVLQQASFADLQCMQRIAVPALEFGRMELIFLWAG